AGGQLVQVVVGREGGERALFLHARDAAAELAECAAKLNGPASGVAVPERGLAGLTWRRRDDYLLRRDALDAPGAGAEHKRLTRAALVHHLLVELAHAGTALAEKHAVQAALRDGAAAGHRNDARVTSCHHSVGDAVPDEAG